MENTMKERKWEELNRDCLIHIISKVMNTDHMLESVPFVCKSWYDATLDPKCWQNLLFPKREVSTEYIKLVIGRSQHKAISLFFPETIPVDGFIYISDECSELMVLNLSRTFIKNNSLQISEHIGKFKNLEFFGKVENMSLYFHHLFIQPNGKHFDKILESISMHCSNFSGLLWQSTRDWDNGISSIIKFLPKIKLLDISYGRLSKNDIMMLLKGCKELENFQVIQCIEDDDDNVIRSLASHVKNFRCTGSVPDVFLDSIKFKQSIEDALKHCGQRKSQWTPGITDFPKERVW